LTAHPTIAAFGQEDGCLTVGGVRIDRLAARVGATPYFAYDRKLLTSRVDHLRATLPADIHLSYAVKANPMPAVVQHLAGLVDGFDVASSLEMQVVLDTTKSSSEVSFAGPGKTNAELTQAIAGGVMIELESLGEARRVTAIGNTLGIRPRVALRVNPDFQIKGSGMRMGGGPQQFGMDAELVPEALTYFVAAGLDFHGFHIFAGSQNLHAEILCEAQAKIAELFLKMADGLPAPVRYLNMGGGFGIPYFDKDQPLDLARVSGNLEDVLARRLRPAFPGARMVIELGRYIVGECGVYVTRVVDRKVSRGKTYLVVDGGLQHQLAASGNFGQVIRRNYPVAVGNRMSDETRETVSVVGNLCTPLDLLADQVSLPHAEVDDFIVLFQAGAYGLTASPTAFLSHPMPAEALV
jgi:diaminopimelate decarboxylase